MGIANKNCAMYMDLKDIIREHTLPFLPAKSLFRFKGVCRDWKLQISTPFFVHNQSNSFHDFSGFFCQSCSKPPSFISLDPNSYGVPDPSLQFLPEPVDIKTSSHGLLCCQGRTVDKAYYICNPATKQWKKLPKPNADHGSKPALVLVFEPSLLNFVADYKLICAFSSADFDDACEFEIYSSKEGCWRISGDLFFGAAMLRPNSGVHVNGIVYWLSMNGGVILFDLGMERSQRLFGLISCLGVMNGKLISTNFYNQTLHVSVLSNAYTNTMGINSGVRTWDTILTVKMDNLPEDSGLGPPNDRQPVHFSSGDITLLQQGRKLYTYDRKTKEFGCSSDEADYDATIFGYVNSLVEI